MKITRRQLMGGALGAVLLPAGVRAAAPATLRAGPVERQLAPGGYPPTALWGYEGSAPGPEIRLPQNARLERRLVNGLPQATSVHWHGIRIDNAMDGVPGLTQEAVAPGGQFDYAFRLPDAGTFWYHAHNRSTEQVARGLHGALIVEEAEGRPEIDAEEVLLLDDWRMTPEAALSDDFDNLHDRSHAGRIGNYVTTNGRGDWSRTVRRHERLRLRLVNVANARIFELALAGLEGWVVALDGMPLDRPRPVQETLVLAPAQRADLIVDVTVAAGETAYLVHLTREGGMAQAAFEVTGQAAKAPRPAPHALPPNPNTGLPELTGARRLDLRMEGGAMGRLSDAMTPQGPKSMQGLTQEGLVWALNGFAGLPEAPLAEAARGETLRIALVNDTAFPHGMHLHGHHFREVLPDRLGPLRDTILVERGTRREIAMVADNPGDWLFHCHMLGHQAAGMKTWLRVA
ncbi:MAG: multicopper oxidase family protein [Paracoccaceae bacterium]